jgi:WD40 repeat protein
LIVSGHPDHIVRTWDPRQKVIQPTLMKSHKSWIRQVKWMNSSKDSNSTYQFLSCADDNSCKVWDIRSTIPLHTIVHHVLSENEAKMASRDKYRKWKAPFRTLCGDWSSQNEKKIFTGSSDCTSKKHIYE